MTTAYEVFEAVFDTANDIPEEVLASREALVEQIDDYAFNAMDINLTKEVAEKIADAYISYEGLDEEGGAYENAYYYKVIEPLSEIEV